ncbi:MAG: hypothetical protein M3N57_03400 [Actinomycetota bacterium]|nr:hypothetical protein [Actinomycetota bacterium]
MDTLETGDIHFLYKPVVDEEDPQGLVDVQDFFVVLHPRGRDTFRLLVVGRKRLPEVGDTERLWGFVKEVTDDADGLRDALGPAEYDTATVGRRHQPGARPAGQGVYALARRGRDTFVAYQLHSPDQPGDVQDVLRIAPEARFVLAVKNPDVGAPPGAGLPPDARADLPPDLHERFDGRRWLAADPPAFLDHEGAEFVLIGAREDVDVDGTPPLDPDDADDLLRQLDLDREEHPPTPLRDGAWD